MMLVVLCGYLMMSRMHNTEVVGKFIAAVISMAALVFVGNTSVYAAQAISPIATDSPSTNDLGTTNGAADQNLYHVLKNENSSQVFDVDMYAYFDSNAAGRFVAITDRNTNPNDRCMTTGNQRYDDGNPATPAANDYFVRVTLTLMNPNPATPVANRSVTYNIPRSQVCGSGYSATPNPYGSNNSNFFRPYPLPTGFTASLRDGETNLYKVRVLIDLNRNVPQEDTGSTTNRQQAMFKVRTDNTCGANSCFFSSIPTASAIRNTSTLGSMTGAEYKRIRMYFGLPCSVDTATSVAFRVYDVDNQSTGSSWDDDATPTPLARRWARFLIEQRPTVTSPWSALPAAAYTGITGADPNSPISYFDPTYGANRSMIRPDNVGYSNTLVQFTMQPRTQYRVTLGPIWSGNLVGFGLPQENIFGKIDCNVGVTGRVDSTPATGPLMAGDSLTFAPYLTRNDTSAFSSNVNHELYVWYNTASDTTYDPGAGDDRVTIPANCSLFVASRLLNGSSGDVPLPTCPLTVDTSRAGGNAVAICARLVIGANDALTQVTQPAVRCLSVGKRPHLYAANGDVFAGGVLSGFSCTLTVAPIISGSEVTVGANKYSSWGTYGITSLGATRGFGSSNTKAGQLTPDWRQLIFSNRTVAGPGPLGAVNGYFYNTNANTSGLPTQTRCLNEPFSTFSQGATNPGVATGVDLNVLVGAGGGTFRRFYNATGTFTVTASAPIPRNTKIVIDVRGASADVKIDSNILYDNGPYASINEIPQVVILSGRDIIIDDAVSRVDAVLGARRDLITCELPPPTTEPRLGVCNSHLQVNGAVVAGGKVRPYRTWGGEISTANSTNYDTPAETFNLTPNFLLNALPSAGNPDVSIRTVTEKEAPPRF